MAAAVTMRMADLAGLLNRCYPPDLAEEWDNVGLQVGDSAQEITAVMVALDPGMTAVKQALAHQCQALITHHPLLFKGLKKISPGDETGRIIYTAIKADLAIFSCHTNLDSAANGLNDWLAARLALCDCKPLQPPQGGDLLKLVVYVPRAHEEAVARAVWAAGAGCIGAYDHCSFRAAGIGTFRPGRGSAPFIGRVGSDERVDEVRFETVVSRAACARVVARMLKAHPYEEVAYDLIPLANRRDDVGLGRIGTLEHPLGLEQFAERCKNALDCAALRLVAAPGRQQIKKVAVCGGSGAALVHAAARQGADVLVTGDMKYHEALTAQALGVSVIDAGHFATERLMAQELAARLRAAAAERRWQVEFMVADEVDPFVFV